MFEGADNRMKSAAKQAIAVLTTIRSEKKKRACNSKGPFLCLSQTYEF